MRLIEHLHIVEILRDAEHERQRLLSELRIIPELQSQSEPPITEPLAQSDLGKRLNNDTNDDSFKDLLSLSNFDRGRYFLLLLDHRCPDRFLLLLARVSFPTSCVT